MKSAKIAIIRAVYLYLVTAITIVLILISTIGLLNVVLDNFVFDVRDYYEFEKYYECENPDYALKPLPTGEREAVAVPSEEGTKNTMSEEEKAECIAEAKEKREQQRWNDIKRETVDYVSMLIIALPLYLIHWGIIKKEAKK